MIYNEIRRKTKKLRIGNIYIGGDSPIAIQSMTNTDTCDREATLKQILWLQSAGCDIVRITVPTLEAAETIPYLKENGVYIPIVADIQTRLFLKRPHQARNLQLLIVTIPCNFLN